MSPPLISKETARYTSSGGKEHCSLCRHFSPRRGGMCARVLGAVSPRGWCKLFTREVRALIADASSFNGNAGGPALTLDFLTPGTLDPRLTFSRASGGTYFDSAGVMRNAATNLWLQSADMANAATAKTGLVVAAPTVTANQTTAPDGTLTAARVVYPAVTGAGALSAISQNTTSVASAYAFSVYLRGNVGGEQVYLNNNTAGVYNTSPRITLTTEWQRYVLITPALAAGFNHYFAIGVDLRNTGVQTASSAQTIYAWGGQIEVGSAATPYIATTTTPMGAPRWDYDPATLALRGLLLEDARTNLSWPSATFTGNWAPLDVTVTPGQAGAPDGTATVTRIAETATTAIHYLGQNPTLVASTMYTFSVYAKMAQIRYLQLSLDNGASHGGYATFDLQAGVVSGILRAMGTGVIGAASVQPVGNGFYRCAISTTIGAFTTSRAIFVFSPNADPGFAPSYAGNAANGLLVWGAQIEAGAFATSHIPTTSAAVTRAQDYCAIPPANMGSWYKTTGGTFLAEFINNHTNPTNARVAGTPGSGGGPSPFFIELNTRRLGQWDGGSALMTTNAVVLGAVSRGASAYAGTLSKQCLDGGPVASNAAMSGGGTGSISAFGLSFFVTSPAGNNDNCYGHLRRFNYYARVLADSEMQALTAGDPPSLDLSFMVPGALDQRISFSRASVGTYTDATGTIQTAVVNQPRWDYDAATRTLKGLLIEEARTNISTDFTGYNDNATTRTFNAGIAPDGTNTMVRLTETSAANIHFTQRVSTTTTNVMYIFSVYAKAAENRYLQLFSDNGTNDGAFVTFDLQTGTISQAAQVRGVGVLGGATIQPCSGGVFRVSLGVQVVGTVYRSGILLSQTAAPGFAPSYPGNAANGLLVWGAQLEAGAFPTSYIATAGSAQTRAADVCSIPTAAWFNASTLSLLYEFSLINGINRLVGGICDGNFNNALYLGTGGATEFVATRAGFGSANTSTVLPVGAVHRGAASYTTTRLAACADGAPVVGAAMAAVPLTTATRLSIGSSPWALDNQMSGWMRRVAVWPRTLADFELQSVSAIAAATTRPTEPPEPPPVIDNELPTPPPARPDNELPETPTPRGRRNGR